MKDIGSLSHTKWECKYHSVFIPKYRRKALYYELRQYLGEIFRGLAAQRECQVEEGACPGIDSYSYSATPGKETRQTNQVERLNNTFRQRLSRLVSKSLSFSTKLGNHRRAIWYFIHDYNARLAKV
jgi:hypothetical protein